MTSLAKRIEKRLAALNKSARSASLEVGSNPTLISDILRGLVRNPRSDTMAKLAAALDTTREWLTDGDGEDSPPPRVEAPPPNVGHRDVIAPLRPDLPRDVPVLGTAAGSLSGAFQFEGGVIDYVLRPPALVGAKDVYAIYVDGTSMEPEHFHGSLRFVHPHRPINVGDSVLINARYTKNGPSEGFIKRLVRRTSDRIIVEQHNPKAQIEFKKEYVASMHKVLSMNELFGL